MVTKWKKFLEGMKNKETRKRWLRSVIVPVACIVPAVAAFFFFLDICYSDYMSVVVWRVGIVINLMLAPAVIYFCRLGLRRRYRNWQPESSAYYQEWQQKFKRQQQMLLVVFLAQFLIETYLFRLALSGWDFVYGYTYGYRGNLATNYLLFFTTIVQCALAEIVIIRFMLTRLQAYMDALSQIHERELEETMQRAMEIEEESRTKVSRSERLRMELISNVSHDLKTPLTSMVGYLELLKKEELGDTARDYLEVISKRAEKLKEMIESLFSLAKVSSGNVEMKRERMTMNRLMEQIFADMEDRIRDSGLEFVTRYTESDTGMVSDSGYMYRICQNLMENALKYAARGTRVFIKTYIRNGSDVCLEITNTAGYLMDFDTEDIVERFARADASRTTEGNGLGLAIVSTYAKALGGQFDIFVDCDQFKARLMFPGQPDGKSGSSDNGAPFSVHG